MQPLLTAFYRLFVPTDISLPKINEFILYFARLALTLHHTLLIINKTIH